MAEVGGDFGQRGENEVPLEHARVRNLQLGLVDGDVVVEENVEIDEAGAFRKRLAAAHVGFDLAEGGKEFAGGEKGFGKHGGVEEPGLVKVVDRFGLIEGGDSLDANGVAVEKMHRFAEVLCAIADIGAERDVGGGHWGYFRAERCTGIVTGLGLRGGRETGAALERAAPSSNRSARRPKNGRPKSRSPG